MKTFSEAPVTRGSYPRNPPSGVAPHKTDAATLEQLEEANASLLSELSQQAYPLLKPNVEGGPHDTFITHA